MSAHLVEDGVPIPEAANRRRNGLTAVFKSMTSGQSISFPASEYSRVGALLSAIKRRNRAARFTMRKTDGETFRVWRLEDAS